MLAHALLAVIAATERAEHPPPYELIALCNGIRHLFTKLITEPTRRLTDRWPGHTGADATNIEPAPATTATNKLSSYDHDSWLVC
jgi:hypothetical protein